MTKSEEIMALRGFSLRHKEDSGAVHPEWPVCGHVAIDGAVMLFVSAYMVRRWKLILAGVDAGEIDHAALQSETSVFIGNGTRDGWTECYWQARIFAQKVFYFPEGTQGGDVYDYR